jgi:beta-glucosidase
MSRRHRTVLGAGVAVLVLGSVTSLGEAQSASGAPAAVGQMGRVTVTSTHSGARPWLNANQSPGQRAQELLSAMNLADKVHMLHGVATDQSPVPTDGYIPPIPSLGVPPITMSDGPAGIRNGQRSTELPAPIALAGSWNTHLARTYGTVIGRDARALGQDQVFAPAMNIDRDPRDGRNFEYFSEDPLLSGYLAGAVTKGIQSQDVIATLKHYVANNSETQRGFMSSDVSDRALHEIYEKNFGIAVSFGHPGSVMCSYNQINSVYACSNPYTLGDLRHVFGFNGYVVSDYPATHQTTDLAMGLNIELPRAIHFTLAKIRAALASKQISMGQINRRVYHTLKVLFQYGIFDRALATSQVPEKQDNLAARHIEEQGAVLLKNANNQLPLGPTDTKIAVIGYPAKHSAQGGGSSGVQPLSIDNGYEGITDVAGSNTTVTYNDGSNMSSVAASAAAADVAVVFVRDYSTEGADRTTLALPDGQDKLVRSVAAANPHTVVVLETGAPVLMPWLNRVSAVLEAWYPGARGGHAIARLLFGDVNPSGKLTQTWPVSTTQVPASTPREFPGVNGNEHYSEGVDVGYRWYYDHHQRPAFPFGYGGSYTSFAYSGLNISRTAGTSQQRFGISFQVRNTGTRAGRDIVQAYVSKPDRAVHTPNRELASFANVQLAPGATSEVHMRIGPRQLAYWDSNLHAFAVQRGQYRIAVGGSSGFLPLSTTYTVTRRLGTVTFRG